MISFFIDKRTRRKKALRSRYLKSSKFRAVTMPNVGVDSLAGGRKLKFVAYSGPQEDTWRGRSAPQSLSPRCGLQNTREHDGYVEKKPYGVDLEIQSELSDHPSDGKNSQREQHGSKSAQMLWLHLFVTEHVSYFSFHLTYILTLCILGSLLLYNLEKGRIKYIDALFIATSACSLTGLATVDISRLSLSSQWVILLCITLCSNVLLSTVPLIIRLYFYNRRAKSALNQLKCDSSKTVNVGSLLKKDVVEYQALVFLLKCVLGYFFILPFISICCMAIYLSRPQQMAYAEIVVAAREQKMSSSNVWFFSLFHSVSAFGNCGFALHEFSLVPFSRDYGILLPLSFLILLGNTYYPIAMYCLIWFINRCQNYYKARKEAQVIYADVPSSSSYYNGETSHSITAKTQFLLENPRRCFTHMFPAHQTLLLFCVASGLLFFQMIIFISLDFNKPYLSHLSVPHRFLSVWYQIVCTRTAGFSTVDIFQTSEAIKLFWVCFMYIVSYPFIIAVRTSTIEVNLPCSRSRLFHEVFSKCYSFRIKNFAKTISSFFKTNRVVARLFPTMFSPPTYVEESHHSPLSFDDSMAVENRKQKNKSYHYAFRSEKQSGSYDQGKDKTTEAPTFPSISFMPSTTYSPHSVGVLDKGHQTKSIPSQLCPETETSFFSPERVAFQIYSVLAKDIFWLFLSCALICIMEDDQFSKVPRLTVFSIIFETVSSYGTVGLSLGFDSSSLSLSAIFSPLSKCFIMLVMLSGRHRCLPLAIDRAVNLPTFLDMPTVGHGATLSHPSLAQSDPSSIRRWISQPCSVKNKNLTHALYPRSHRDVERQLVKFPHDI